ncbi:MAG: RNA methyltransferase [Clostridia bacterium]|nr:RNA methyltransferase [Clostridia bacterium]
MKNIKRITDFSAPELDVFVRLTGAQLRNRLEPEKGIFIAESPTVIEVALNAGLEPVAFLTDKRLINTAVKSIIERLSEYPTEDGCGVPIYVADREVLTSLTGFELTRGALCAMRRPRLPSVGELCQGARRVAVLEEVADSTNIGALFRSAAALGIDAVLITPTCCDPLCRRAVRVSMGTVFQVPWGRIGSTPADWPEQGISELKSLGFKTAAMALSDNSVSIDDPALLAEPRLAIVLGTEGNGLKSSTIADCDYTVKIPMSHGVDSLNVAAAGAVAFWQLTRK